MHVVSCTVGTLSEGCQRSQGHLHDEVHHPGCGVVADGVASVSPCLPVNRAVCMIRNLLFDLVVFGRHAVAIFATSVIFESLRVHV